MSVVISKVDRFAVSLTEWIVMTLILRLTDDMLPNVCDSGVTQPGGNVGEEARGPERHPGE